jgi:hypothetical protein
VLVQDAAAHGKDIAKMKLHECKCPPCFKAGANLRGQLTCSPACDLGSCNLETGACAGAGGGGSGGGSLRVFSRCTAGPAAASRRRRLRLPVSGALSCRQRLAAMSAVPLSCADGAARPAASGADWWPVPPPAHPIWPIIWSCRVYIVFKNYLDKNKIKF